MRRGGSRRHTEMRAEEKARWRILNAACSICGQQTIAWDAEANTPDALTAATAARAPALQHPASAPPRNPGSRKEPRMATDGIGAAPMRRGSLGSGLAEAEQARAAAANACQMVLNRDPRFVDLAALVTQLVSDRRTLQVQITATGRPPPTSPPRTPQPAPASATSPLHSPRTPPPTPPPGPHSPASPPT